MTTVIFNDWLEAVNHKMKLANQKVVMLLDNHLSYNSLELSNIIVMKFPFNMTAWLQPCDAGIIASFKKNY